MPIFNITQNFLLQPCKHVLDLLLLYVSTEAILKSDLNQWSILKSTLQL